MVLSRPYSSILLTSYGVGLVSTGLYFVFVRPAFGLAILWAVALLLNRLGRQTRWASR